MLSPPGVYVDVEPFLKIKDVALGQNAKGSYVEFLISKSKLSKIPGYLGGKGNAAKIITNGKPLKLAKLSARFVRWAWLGI